MSDRELVDTLLTAPAGVALLHSLETECRTDMAWYDSPTDSQPAAVGAAVALVDALTFGEIVQRAVAAADRIGGPWMPEAPATLGDAYRLAPARVLIADQIVERFGDALCAPIDTTVQEWWSSAPGGRSPAGLFAAFDDVYCCGEFTFHGLWTVTQQPTETHHELIDMWELSPHPIGRWHLPVRSGIRVFEVHGVDDWALLVTTCPRIPATGHSGWELPGPNQHTSEMAVVEVASGGRAARRDVNVVMPDWERVAADYDGVHLSWAGMLGAEGHVVAVPELGPRAVTMLRFWRSERTLWLRDVFVEPEPRRALWIDPDHRQDEPIVVDVTTDDDRREADRRNLRILLGRDPA